MFIDTHCHLNFESYDNDRSQVIVRAQQAGIHHIIIPAIDIETCHQALMLADNYPSIHVAVGVHPNSTADFNEDHLNTIRTLAEHKKVVAIGEIGLDYHWNKSPKERQIQAFRAQLALSQTLQLPVIIHNREASADIMTILEEWVSHLPPTMRSRPGVLHSFSGSAEIASRALDNGFYIGFTGPVTFKKADELRAIAAMIPIDRILVETDGPFLTPHPHRGKRNEPAYIPFIVEKLATIKGVTTEEMARYTTQNARHLFRL